MRGYLRPNHLQRHAIALKQAIFHLVDLTHTAARDKAHHEKALRNGFSRSEARSRLRRMVKIDVRDGCSGSHVRPARDDRPAKEATGAFIFPQQFLNQPSQRSVSSARVVEKSLPCRRL